MSCVEIVANSIGNEIAVFVLILKFVTEIGSEKKTRSDQTEHDTKPLISGAVRKASLDPLLEINRLTDGLEY